MTKVPHPIPYQGSKRGLAEFIGQFIPERIDTWYEPFAGSAAMTLWVAAFRTPRRMVIGEGLAPMAELWSLIINNPESVVKKYRNLWLDRDKNHLDRYYQVRDKFNRSKDPVHLLYLLCRCVKNSVRFNNSGGFSQSVDKRRLGTHPDRLERAIFSASNLLKGRTTVRSGDWLSTLARARKGDFIYLDPPYAGTSSGNDRRYASSLEREKLVAGLKALNQRDAGFILSYDGSCGDISYGPPLPSALRLTHLKVKVGRSTQATLNGLNAETVESIYLSEILAGPLQQKNIYSLGERCASLMAG